MMKVYALMGINQQRYRANTAPSAAAQRIAQGMNKGLEKPPVRNLCVPLDLKPERRNQLTTWYGLES